MGDELVIENAIELLIDAAKQHGQDSEPDHEVGDLQDALRVAYGLMSPDQRSEFFDHENVQSIFDCA